MRQGVLIAFLAIFALPLIGAGNDGHASPTDATIVGPIDATLNPEERLEKQKAEERVAKILGEGQLDLSSSEEPTNSSSTK